MSGLLNTNAEISKIVKENYLVVLIDVDKGHNADVVKQYGNPVRFGLPVLVVLDSDGKQLATQDTGQLEHGDHHDPAKVIAFLESGRSQKRPKRSRKRVAFEFTRLATRCDPSRLRNATLTSFWSQRSCVLTTERLIPQKPPRLPAPQTPRARCLPT